MVRDHGIVLGRVRTSLDWPDLACFGSDIFLQDCLAPLICRMPRPLPPLSSLRSFEAVARQLSFSKAAEELIVTPGAVSQQIRALEERLGSRLFDRTKRSVTLTRVATWMLPDVQAGLGLLARACSDRTVPLGERTL